MAEKVSARRQVTRTRLMDAAVELFAERGVLAASVEEICERAGFTRGAFYSNFESKDELCLAVMERFGNVAIAGTREAGRLAAGVTPFNLDECVTAAVAAFFELQPSDPAAIIAHAELRLHAARTPAVRAGLEQMTRQVSEAIGEVMQSAFDGIGATLVLPIDQAVEVLHGVFEHGSLQAAMRGTDEPRSVQVERLAAVVRLMIRVPES